MNRTILSFAAAAFALLLAGSAQAQGVKPDTVDLEAAKKEGKISWYTSTPIETAQKLVALFEQQYPGIKVQLFRSGGSAVLSRFMQEHDAGRIGADVLTTSDPATAAVLTKKGFFVPFKPANFDKIPAAVKDKDGNWIAQRINIIAMFARGDKLAEADRPKKWTDILDPKYKGKMVMADPSFTSLQLTAVGALSKLYGWQFYEKLQKNDIMIVQGHQQVSDMLKRGERILAAEGDFSYAEDDRHTGHPIVNIFPSDGVFAIPSPNAVIKGGPNPNAAKLFAEFNLGDEVQKLFPDVGAYPSRTDMPPPKDSAKLGDLKLIEVDYEAIESQTSAIKKKFNEIFQ
jgi:iron(III) transport system substrate-binding protein